MSDTFTLITHTAQWWEISSNFSPVLIVIFMVFAFIGLLASAISIGHRIVYVFIALTLICAAAVATLCATYEDEEIVGQVDSTETIDYVIAEGTIDYINDQPDTQAVELRLTENPDVLLRFDWDRERLIGREGSEITAVCKNHEQDHALGSCELGTVDRYLDDANFETDEDFSKSKSSDPDRVLHDHQPWPQG